MTPQERLVGTVFGRKTERGTRMKDTKDMTAEDRLTEAIGKKTERKGMKEFLFMSNSDWAEEMQVCLAEELEEVLKGWDDQIAQGAQDAAAEHNYIARMDGEDEVTVKDVAAEMLDDLRRSWFVLADEALGDFIAESNTRRYTASDAAEAEIERLRNFCGACSEGEPVSRREAEMFKRTTYAQPCDVEDVKRVIAECEEWFNANPDIPENDLDVVDTESTLDRACEAQVWLESDPRHQVLHMKDDDGDWFLRVLPEEE